MNLCKAIKAWIKRYKGKKWPDSVLEFEGISDFPDIKSLRGKIGTPKNN